MDGRCQRCRKETNCTTMSWFNEQMICMDCSAKEAKRDDFQEAKNKENQEVLNGNYNYQGIGL
jgi:hypothetical protein